MGVLATLASFLPVLVIPILGVFFSIFSPLPTLLSYYRLDRPLGFVIPVGVMAVSWVVLAHLNATQGLFYLGEMILLGLVLGAGMRKGLSLEKTVGGASLAVFGVSSVIFWYSQGGIGSEVFQGLEKEFKESITAVLRQHESLSDGKYALDQVIDKFSWFLVRLLPGVTLASTVIVAWLNLLMAVRFCRAQSVALPSWPEWTRWGAPDYLVWPVIAAGFGFVLPSMTSKIIALNFLIVFGAVYLLQGLAIVVFYFDRWKLPKVLRALFYILLLLQQFATLGVVFLGFFDVWFDFRRLSQKSAPGS